VVCRRTTELLLLLFIVVLPHLHALPQHVISEAEGICQAGGVTRHLRQQQQQQQQ
jgi:hypothetical protein